MKLQVLVYMRDIRQTLGSRQHQYLMKDFILLLEEVKDRHRNPILKK